MQRAGGPRPRPGSEGNKSGVRLLLGRMRGGSCGHRVHWQAMGRMPGGSCGHLCSLLPQLPSDRPHRHEFLSGCRLNSFGVARARGRAGEGEGAGWGPGVLVRVAVLSHTNGRGCLPACVPHARPMARPMARPHACRQKIAPAPSPEGWMPTVESSCALVTPILTATPRPCMISAASGPTCVGGRSRGARARVRKEGIAYISQLLSRGAA